MKGRENLDTKSQREGEYLLEPEKKISCFVETGLTYPGYGPITDKHQYGKGLSVSV
jgi:hypothetical protein